MAPRKGPARRLLCPEVIQTSAMDCGPASLKCLLEGFGIPASYGRLREACQTDVDGTSIDTLEELAGRLGLAAQQVMVPADHLLVDDAASLPALVVVTLPNGFTHFVVVWRTHGPLVQVMDPGSGRRWMSRARLLEQIYLHAQVVPAADWREYAGTEDFLAPLASRMSALGLPGERLKKSALADPSWRALATLDAAVRFTASLHAAGALRRGREATGFVESLLSSPSFEAAAQIPEGFWFVRPAASDPSQAEGELLSLRGAVLVQIQGLKPEVEGASATATAAVSPELAAVLEEPPDRPARKLLSLMREDGLLAPAVLATGLLASAGMTLLEGLILRGLVDLAWMLPVGLQKLSAMGVIAAFLALALFVDHATASGLRGLGRRLEARFRIAFLSKLPKLGDRYFHSRPISDMAARGHSISQLRTIPVSGGQLVRSVAELLATTAGLAWLNPAGTPLMAAVCAGCVALPILAQRWLTEQEMRLRIHAGALSQFYLDSLLGLVTIRAHGAERAMRSEHEARLVEWGRTGYAMGRVVIVLQALAALLGVAAAIVLMAGYLHTARDAGAALLLVYWTLNIPLLGSQIASHAQQYPVQRNAALRILEPLGAPEEEDADEQGPTASEGPRDAVLCPGAALELRDVRVVAAGHAVLDSLHLKIEPGSHLAIVGPSGAGKSSLLGLFLGWHRAANGEVRVDGQRLDSRRLVRLRQQTAWIDPAVQLWNRGLLDNLRYGATGAPDLGGIVEAADLRSVLERLPEGLQTPVGEGGGLISGGEGQRTRIGRAMARKDARLVLMDEAFRGLELSRRADLLARSRAHWANATLLCVTHDIEHALSFKRVVVIEGGRIVEDGAPVELAASQESRFRALLEAERSVRRKFWQGAGWRRLRLEAGRIEEKTGGQS